MALADYEKCELCQIKSMYSGDIDWDKRGNIGERAFLCEDCAKNNHLTPIRTGGTRCDLCTSIVANPILACSGCIQDIEERAAREMAECIRREELTDLRAHSDWNPSDTEFEATVRAGIEACVNLWKERRAKK